MTIEEQLKSIILSKYKSVRAFANANDLAYSTVDSIFKRGIGGIGVGKAIKIFNALGLDVESIESGTLSPAKQNIIALTQPELTHIKKYRALDRYGKKMVDTVLDLEVERKQQLQTFAACGGLVEAPAVADDDDLPGDNSSLP
jgi:repressor LexA